MVGNGFLFGRYNNFVGASMNSCSNSSSISRPSNGAIKLLCGTVSDPVV